MPDFLFSALVTLSDLSQFTINLDVTNQPDLATATVVAEYYVITNQARWASLPITGVVVTVQVRP